MDAVKNPARGRIDHPRSAEARSIETEASPPAATEARSAEAASESELRRPTASSAREARQIQSANFRTQYAQFRLQQAVDEGAPPVGAAETTPPSTPGVSGEVSDESQITGPGQWTRDDRINNTARWQEANLYNLENGHASRYQTIEQRRDFYSWFYQHSVDQGFETRWPLAASIVATGADQVAYPGVTQEAGAQTVGTISNELQGFMRIGNQTIFDDAFPKLQALLAGPPLTGAAALEWDMNTLSEEQALIQPLYSNMSDEAQAQMEAIAKQEGWAVWVGRALTSEDTVEAHPGPDGELGTGDDYNRGGDVPALPSDADLTSIDDRWSYGMELGRLFAPTDTGYQDGVRRPAVSPEYTHGEALAEVNRRPNLHMLDGEIDAAMGYASITRVQELLTQLSPEESAELARNQRPDGGTYASRLAMLTRVPRSVVFEALPPGPARDAFMAEYDQYRPFGAAE